MKQWKLIIEFIVNYYQKKILNKINVLQLLILDLKVSGNIIDVGEDLWFKDES